MDAMTNPGTTRTTIVALVVGAALLATLRESETHSNALAELEAEAMQAVSDVDLERARNILHGAAYHDRTASFQKRRSNHHAHSRPMER